MARLCEICKQPIDADRVEGIPATRLCTKHAEEILAFGGEFIVTGKREKTSKESSFKTTHGGVDTVQTRNYAAINRLKDAYDKERNG